MTAVLLPASRVRRVRRTTRSSLPGVWRPRLARRSRTCSAPLPRGCPLLTSLMPQPRRQFARRQPKPEQLALRHRWGVLGEVAPPALRALVSESAPESALPLALTPGDWPAGRVATR